MVDWSVCNDSFPILPSSLEAKWIPATSPSCFLWGECNFSTPHLDLPRPSHTFRPRGVWGANIHTDKTIPQSHQPLIPRTETSRTTSPHIAFWPPALETVLTVYCSNRSQAAGDPTLSWAPPFLLCHLSPSFPSRRGLFLILPHSSSQRLWLDTLVTETTSSCCHYRKGQLHAFRKRQEFWTFYRPLRHQKS